MKKRALFLFAIRIGLLAALTVTASAAGTVASGKAFGSAEWVLDSDGVLTITDNGAMREVNTPSSGEHVYTGSMDEVNNLIAAGWNYEQVAFNYPALGAPVYRLYDEVSGDHLYTMRQDEIDRLSAQGWKIEGVAFNSAAESEVAQYRLYNPNAHRNGMRGAWHFTSSAEERDWLISLGWQDQGIGWYSTLT